MDFMKLKATLSLDSSEYESGLDNAETKAIGAGKGMSMAMKAGIASVAAAVVAVGAVVKKSVEAYAEYEQMVGGVKKLYGNMGMSLEDYADSVGKSVSEVEGEYNRLETSQNMVLDNAKKAYKTTGMSMNEYMSTATSFSAALINSLGGDTVAAAKQTDVAMRAISDNFNTFGGDIGLIQQAFQGFAKQNYTMLDNLKLGYGGTKTEMERLIDDANAYAEANGQAADLSIDSFSDIVTAIDLIQQKQHIAGTTAREGATTIEGSLMTLKAAWENLMTGLADPDADIAELVKNVTESAMTAAGNIGPAILQALQGIGEAIGEALPGLPNLVESLAAKIGEGAPTFIQAGIDLVGDLIEGLVTAIPSLIVAGLDLITNLINGIGEGGDDLFNKVLEIMGAFIKALIKATPQIVVAGTQLIKALLNAMLKLMGTIPSKLAGVARKIPSSIKSGLGSLASIGKQFIQTLLRAVLSRLAHTATSAQARARSIKEKIRSGLGSLYSIGSNLIQGLWNGIKSKWDALVSWFSGAVESLKTKARQILSINSPSKVFMEIGKAIPEGMGLGIERNMNYVDDALEDMASRTVYLDDDLASSTSTTQETIDIAFEKTLGELADQMKQGMADAVEGLTITLDKRAFGRATRKAVGVV